MTCPVCRNSMHYRTKYVWNKERYEKEVLHAWWECSECRYVELGL